MLIAMSFAFIILLRVLFVACMVFIIGYIFGSFGKRPALRTLSKIAAILVIVLFAAMNILFVRTAFGSHRYGRDGYYRECRFHDRPAFHDRHALPEDSAGIHGTPGGNGGERSGELEAL